MDEGAARVRLDRLWCRAIPRTARCKRARSAVACGRADLRGHGIADGDAGRRHAGHALLGRGKRIAAERNVLDVLVDERLPFGALAETDRPPKKRCPSIGARGFVSAALICRRADSGSLRRLSCIGRSMPMVAETEQMADAEIPELKQHRAPARAGASRALPETLLSTGRSNAWH